LRIAFLLTLISIAGANVETALATERPAPAVSLEVQDAPFGMCNRPWPLRPNAPVAPAVIRVSGKGNVTLVATDAFGRRLAWKKELDLGADPQSVEFAAPMGAYRIEATEQGQTVGSCWIGFIPPFHKGVRKDSFFGSNTSSIRRGDELKFLRAIGMKVQRAHFYGTKPEVMDELKAHDTWVLPIVGYAIDKKSDWAEKFRMHGPPADFDDFVAKWEQVLRQFPQITTWEFWNEPWIFEWTWADTPQQYRKLQTMWCQMALKVNPQMRIIAGNSWMFVQDHIQPFPECWKGLLSGTSHHPYSGAGDLSWRSGANLRSIDGGALITRQMGLPYYCLTEGGTSVGSRDFGSSFAGDVNNIINARKVVQYFVRSAQAGCFQCDMQWGIGYGPQWTMSNTSFALLTHMLEDRPIVADIWPENELISGAIFANPKFVTQEVKALRRSKEISTRWNVPAGDGRSDEATKVAVIWSWTGPSNDKVDTEGTLTLGDASGLRAMDMFGRTIHPTGGKLVLPFGENPVYIVSEALSVIQLRDRIANARIEKATPVNLYGCSLLRPADQKQDLIVRMENQMNVEVSGELTVQVVDGGATSSTRFTIPAAKLADVAIAWPGAKLSAGNQYAINLKAEVTSGDRDLGSVAASQVIQAARFAKKTIAFTGQASDFAGLTPIALTARPKADFTAYLLNPNLNRPETQPTDAGMARIYTAYDDAFVYVGVEGWGAKCSAGQVARPGLTWKRGDPKGLSFISNCGDVVQIAFGFRDRAPGFGRQMNDPWAWKGMFYDTDYQYVAHASTEGPKLIRLWGPDTGRQTAYQIDDVPFVEPVKGAKVMIRDGLYEIAIPRSELKLFDHTKDHLRFTVLLNGRFNWADCAGVFDYWMNNGSFGPSWESRLPCQTLFGISK